MDGRSPRKRIDPREFAKRAGWGEKWNEHTLQMYVKRKLEGQGYEVKDEVWVGNKTVGAGRIDLLATRGDRKIIIECKKWLFPKDMGEAAGQIEMYKSHVTGYTDRVIIGMTPPQKGKAYDAERRALMMKNTIGIQTVFINGHPDFEPSEGDDTRTHLEKTFDRVLETVREGIGSVARWMGRGILRGVKKHCKPWRLVQHLWNTPGRNTYTSAYGSGGLGFEYGKRRGRGFRLKRTDVWLMALAGIAILVIWF